ncbi:hypothetical protein [Micromonospora sonchi]|uniref:hypothetical protein n=1 Tax=Micromonospora sonchi TaxID=1763543 RepID=UPI001663BD4E|nr:hypothetical protein [Micromonospora sonchi]
MVTTPDGTTTPMTVTSAGHVHTATYTPAGAGAYSYRLTAIGAFVDAVEGRFVVRSHEPSAAPITLDPATDVGMVRLLITDVDETAPLFTDAELQAFLAAERGVKRAAALALETIARSEVLIAKHISTQDLSTNGPSVGAELRASARALREQAQQDEDDLIGGTDAWGISVIDFDPQAAYRRW